MMIFRTPLKIAPALKLALCVSLATSCAISSGERSSVNGSTRQYQATGETSACLRPRDIESVNAIDDRTLIFRVGTGTYYRNVVGPGCKNAASPFRRLQYDVNASSICRGETMNVVDNGDNITTGFCQLGTFEEVRPQQD